jgi:ComF family protein
MNIVVHACRIVFDILFPARQSDVLFDTIDADTLSRLARPPIVRLGALVIAPLPYEHRLVRKAIHAVKYHGHVRATMLLGETLAPFVAEELAERQMIGVFEAPLVIPIPLHTTRERERGFNQSERIALAMIQHLPDTPLLLHRHVLIRIKRTQSQARTTSRQERLQNMIDAFKVQDPASVTGRHIILIDDVVTTGATLRAAEDALLEAGAHEVLCVAVAH